MHAWRCPAARFQDAAVFFVHHARVADERGLSAAYLRPTARDAAREAAAGEAPGPGFDELLATDFLPRAAMTRSRVGAAGTVGC